MKKDWTYKKFEDCIENVKYTTKIQSKDYMASGEYPIISQEEELVSGYWNKNEDVFSAPRPLVVFGDHTRVLKYIDFDFVLGADGVKILLPIEDLEAKFLYYFLKWYNVPNLGYSRHYKLLKEISIPIPPLSIQRSIVAELDLLHSVISKKKEQLRELDNLAQSLFYQMFGDESQWESATLKEVCSSIVRGPFGSALKKDFFVPKNDTTYKVYEQKHAIQKDAFIGSYYITKEKFAELKRFEVFPNDIIMSCSGTIGELFVIPNGAEKGVMNQALLKFHLNELITIPYFMFIMEYVKGKMTIQGCGLQNIGSVKEICKIDFPLPPLSLQQSFAAKVSAIEAQKQAITRSIHHTEALLAQRMDQYFG